MDLNRFDALARTLAKGASRRFALLGLVSAALAALGQSGTRQAAAKRGRKRKKKKKKKNQNPPPPLPCGAGTKPCGAECIAQAACCGGCATEQQCCDGACIASGECCGGCGQDQRCCQSVCIPATECCGGCSAIETCCSGACADLATDGAHCGACGHACATDVCVHGACDCLGLQANCPAPCGCLRRLNDVGRICTTGGIGACDEDDDCVLGSVCLFGGICSNLCLV